MPHRRSASPILPGFALVLFAAAAAPAGAEDLQPHRGIYDLSLSDAEPSTSLVAASGRLVFALSGSECAGYNVDFRNVTRVTDREGTERTTDLRSSTEETVSPATLKFSHETFVDGEKASGIEGRAEGRSGGVEVAVTAPKSTELTLERAVFPTAHTRLILDAALAGERILEAKVYDGGDDADEVYETATILGPAQTGLPGASEQEIAVLSQIDNVMSRTAWRLTISYFEAGSAEGERMPDYELTFSMLDNGVAYNVSFDYGAFVLKGRLTELSLQDEAPCPAAE
ncbi:MAG: DUF1849 family protein [Pseudomonadota bacterium]